MWGKLLVCPSFHFDALPEKTPRGAPLPHHSPCRDRGKLTVCPTLFEKLMAKELRFTPRLFDFLRELKKFHPAVILSDHGLPAFDGFTALSLAQKQAPDVPFIFVTGSVDRSMDHGAT